VQIRIHRGCREVGGSCVEVEHDGARLVLDVGRPLSAELGDVVALPPVPGLADGTDRDLLAVLVTHPHLDHYGLVDQVHPRVPVYAGAAASAIVQAAAFFSPSAPALGASGVLEHRVPIQLGPFTVTPWLVDHSAFDSYALVLDAGGERLMYTGDFRGHGRKARLFQAMLADAPSGVDSLIMEGTHVSPDPAVEYGVPVSEPDVERAMVATFTATAGLPVVVSSAQNIDRLVTVYRAARRSGRVLLMDLYGATVAAATRPTIPQPGFPGLGVFIPRRQRALVKGSGEFERTRAVREVRVFGEQLVAEPFRYVVLSTSAAVPELLCSGALKNGVVIWSLWSGYLAEGSGHRLERQLVHAGVPLVHHHTSGHASIADLHRLVEAIAPGRVVPIHTAGSDQYSRHFPTVDVQEDGQWWACRTTETDRKACA
jgi:ribonuclease J